jgi:hypothetical protein
VVRIAAGTRDVSLPHTVQAGSETPPSLLFRGYRKLLSGRKAVEA